MNFLDSINFPLIDKSYNFTKKQKSDFTKNKLDKAQLRERWMRPFLRQGDILFLSAIGLVILYKKGINLLSQLILQLHEKAKKRPFLCQGDILFMSAIELVIPYKKGINLLSQLILQLHEKTKKRPTTPQTSQRTKHKPPLFSHI